MDIQNYFKFTITNIQNGTLINKIKQHLFASPFKNINNGKQMLQNKTKLMKRFK